VAENHGGRGHPWLRRVTDRRRPEETDVTIPTDQPGRRPDADAPPARPRNALQKVSDVVVSPTLSVDNPFAAAALAVGVIGLLFSAFGLLSSVGVIVSLLGLLRSRRLAREGRAQTGRWQSIVGLAVSVVSLLRWLPLFAPLLAGLR
jgi:hypothetical protein